MKKYKLNDITLMQYICMIHGAQVGIGLLSLPRDLAKIAGTDGWISLLIGWAVAVLASVIIIQVMKKHPDDTLYDLIPRYFGKVIGTILKAITTCYFAFAFFISFIASVFVIRLELMPKTPNFVVVLLFAIPIYVIAKNQVRVLARYAELTVLSGTWLVLFYLYPLKYSVWLNLLPVLKEGWLPVLVAVKTTALSFLGFETAFILYPFLKHKEAAVKGIVIGNTLTMLIYMLISVVCFVFFSPDDIVEYTFPTLRALKVIEYRFLERIEIIILVAYVFVLSRVWIFYLYCAVFGTSQLLGKQDHRPHLRIFLLGLLLLSIFYIPSFEQIDRLKEWFSQMGIYFAFAFPIFLWAYTSLVARFRKGDVG